MEVGEGASEQPPPSSTNLHNLHNLASPQLHIVWMGAAMVDTGLGYSPHAMHTEVS